MKNKICLIVYAWLFGFTATNLFAQGSWSSLVGTGGVEGIHMASLHTDQVFVLGQRDAGPHVYRVFDPLSPLQGTTGSTSGDHFCAGHTLMADGSFLWVDGAANGAIRRYDPATGSFPIVDNTQASDIRWYPSTIILGNGKVVTFGGVNPGGGEPNLLSAEVFDPATNTSVFLNGGGNVLGYQDAGNAYPRVIMVPTNNPNPNIFKILHPGPAAQSYFYEINTDTNTSTLSLGPVDPFTPSGGGGEPAGRLQAMYVTLHDGRVMAAGGDRIDETEIRSNTVSIMDPTAPSPSWSAAANMNVGRSNCLATLLMDGRVLVYGHLNQAEIYEPGANNWTSVPNMAIDRGYHTGGILLPDGRVIVSGGIGTGGAGDFGESDISQYYSPDYLSAGARPTITSSPAQAGYGEVINVGYSSSNVINDVLLRRPGSATHSFTYNMVGVTQSNGDVAVTDNGSSLTITIPSNPTLIPPGYYYLVIFSDNSGTKVPSIAQWIQIDGSAPPPDSNPPSQPSISGFSNVLDVSLTVTSTVSTDTEGSNPVEYDFDETTGNTGGTDSGWQFSVNYTDTGLNASTQYCYRVRARDSQGNTTGYSSTQCRTTTAGPDTNPPTPNPMTFAVAPAAIGDTVINMTATTATDAEGSNPIEYEFDETTANPGATDSGWQQGDTYYDYGLQGGTQYTYRVRARDGLGNTGSYSGSASATTAPEDGFVDISVGPTQIFTPANVTINVGDTVEWTFLEDGHNVWAGLSGAHNFLDSNPTQIAFSSSADPLVTNPTGFVYTATFDQNFLDSSTGDAGHDQYNYHCHIHGSGIPFEMFGTITVNGGTPPPSPSPMTFASAPAATSCSSITMTATTATSANSPVEYLFTETTGGSGATDSNWQLSTTYVDNGLAPSTQYTYNVRARDATGNAGTASTNASATTQSGGGGTWGAQVNNTDSGIAYSGMTNVSASGAFQNDAHYTLSSGSASFSINGGGIRIYVWRTGDVAQSFSISIDGGSAQTVNVGTGPFDSFLAHEDTNLGAGSHNVVINWVSGELHFDAYQVQAGGGSCGSDIAPPTPDPATFASAPAATSSSVIAMTATTGSDASGPVEYLFEESSGNAGGTSSSWQTSTSYSDTGLTGGTEYTYSVQMRDSVGNTTAVSARFSATTTGGGDVTPPTPNPATFAAAPSADSDTAISMTATTASDPSSPVEYNFDNVSGGAGGTDSGWQTSTSYTDLGLSASTQYCYTVQSRDSVGNTGTASAQSCATTQAAPDTTPPTPNPATFASAPAASSDTVINMTATTASDPSGPVEYNFNHVSGTPGGTDSGWQTSTSYTDSGLAGSTQYCYTVQSRDSVGNTGTASAQSCATTQATPDTTPPTPNPATFAAAPASTGTSSIAMTATTGSDPSGPVEYFFTETTANPGGSNSTWQTSTSYTDTLLSPSTQYCYTVTSRDSVGNTGSSSAQSCATTDALPDITPPTPNPATFASVPSADSDTAISMTATTASDPSGPVEYSFDETTAGPGATDSGWQTSTSYTDSGLTANTQYCYTVQSRDSVGNTGTASSAACATTQDVPSDVSLLTAWVTGTTHADPAGSNRALVFTVHAEDDNTNMNASVTYGGQAMTKVVEQNVGTGYRAYTAAFILNDAGIAAASNSTFNVTWAQTPSRTPGFASVFLAGVDQASLTGASSGNGNTSTATVSSAALTTGSGDLVIISGTCGNTGSYTVNNGFTEGTEVTVTSGDGVAGHKLATGVNETPSLTHSNANRQVVVGFVVNAGGSGGGPDTTPPTPNPATFSSAPAASSDTVINMTATTASDPSGPVEYNFDQTPAVGGGTDSGWQTSTSYTDIGLSASTQYCYTVQSRDSVGNTGSASAGSCATTQAAPDTTPPTPNPATFASAPSADSSSAISMTATTASDPSGPVEYNFANTSGGTGGTSSGWQTSTSYTDTGLQASTSYCYTVQSRDSVGNTGTASSAACATTQAGGGCGSGQPFTNFLGAGNTTDITVTQSSVDDTSTGVKTIDGSGLSGNNHGTSEFDAWQSPSTATNPVKGGSSHWIQYDFGHLYTLGVLHVWNHNETCCANRGLNSVTIDYSADGTNWTTLGTFTFPQAPGSGSYTGFDAADFAGVCARYVILTGNSNHGGSFAHSLSEVQFNLVP